jgi:hypothetical protein
MELTNDILNCVCFLCLKQKVPKEGLHFVGTAFFASSGSNSFLITARHNIQEAKVLLKEKPKAYHSGLFARINTSEGSKVIPLKDADWRYPANQATDVAIMADPAVTEEDFEYKYLPLSCSATEEKIRHHGIGIGSEIFVSGLFSLHQGARRNLPIVRRGIIAAMPSEPLRDEKNRSYDAYLAEVLSTRGMSGSPVLVRSNRSFVAGEVPSCGFLLVGVIQGHFRDELEGYSKNRQNDFHAGLSKIIPVQEILKLTNARAEQVKSVSKPCR